MHGSFNAGVGLAVFFRQAAGDVRLRVLDRLVNGVFQVGETDGLRTDADQCQFPLDTLTDFVFPLAGGKGRLGIALIFPMGKDGRLGHADKFDDILGGVTGFVLRQNEIRAQLACRFKGYLADIVGNDDDIGAEWQVQSAEAEKKEEPVAARCSSRSRSTTSGRKA